MNKKIFLSTFACALLFLAPSAVAASTHITDNTIDSNQIWVKANSPYILDTDVWISKDVTLKIGPGVSVYSASTSSSSDEPKSFGISGTLNIAGSPTQRVTMSGLGLIVGSHASLSSTYTDFINSSGVDLSTSTISISTSTFAGSGIALNVRGSKVSVSGSVFKNNRYGIRSSPWKPAPVLVMGRVVDDQAIGGDGNAIDLPVDPTQNIIFVHGTVFENNQSYGVYNQTGNQIDATGNWWGSATGPRLLATGSGDRMFGPISVSPWLSERPSEEVVPVCCSSVVFIPGLQASRLYRDEQSLLGSTTTNKLWEPNRNKDVERLYMNVAGESIDPSVYHDGVIDKALGFSVYDSFIKMMNGMVDDGTINEWYPYDYDWRISVADIVSPDMISKIEDIASNSKTGKVSIIAHSTGGIVSKLLAKRLQEDGKADLVDRIVLVASPELGTPQAMAGILHGDNEAIAGGLILSDSTARELGRNMPGAYGLLPSKAFMNNFLKPIVTIAHASSTDSIASYAPLEDFLLGKNDNRVDPDKTDLKTPVILKEAILSATEALHSLIDNIKISPFTDVVSLVGWGKKTLQTIKYNDKGPSYIKSLLGDGTVHTLSSDHVSHNKELFFDLGKFDKDQSKDISHADILEAQPVLDTVKDLIVKGDDGAIATSSPYVSDTLPAIAYKDNDITIGVHSPASIDMYDKVGRHTGFVASDSTDSDLIKKEEMIPGSSVYTIGDSKYISLSPTDGDEYSVNLSGTGVGVMTIDIARRSDGVESNPISYTDIPVTPLLSATIKIPDGFVGDSSTTTAATLPMSVDFDSNGTVDTNIYQSDTASSTIIFASIRTIINSLVKDSKTRDYILKKIDIVEHKAVNGKADILVKYLKNVELKTSLGHLPSRKASDSDKQIIIDSLMSVIEAI